jgi:hypothetical protein
MSVNTGLFRHEESGPLTNEQVRRSDPLTRISVATQ